jgi:hypothetical protein
MIIEMAIGSIEDPRVNAGVVWDSSRTAIPH